MKKLITILLLFFCCSVFGAMAQTDSLKVQNDSIPVSLEDKPIISKVDSLYLQILSEIYCNTQNSSPRYKMYKTENTYNLLKLDTATGRVWQVQYRMGNTESMTVAIDDYSLLWYDEVEIAGRFELYDTNNMYQFILLDTVTGRTWQVQWNTERDRRFRERIY